MMMVHRGNLHYIILSNNAEYRQQCVTANSALNMTALWDAVPHRLVEADQCFRGA
jgi:hypothetical protein